MAAALVLDQKVDRLGRTVRTRSEDFDVVPTRGKRYRMELVANGVSDDCVIIAQQKLALVHRPQFDAFDLNLIGPDFNRHIAARVALGGHSNRLRQSYRRLIAGLPLGVVSGLGVA